MMKNLIMEKFLNLKEYGQVVKLSKNVRKKLKEVIEGWLILSIKKGLSIPELDGITIEDVKMVRV